MRWLALLVLLLAWATPGRADVWWQPPLGRYEGRTIVTGTDLRSRPAGLAACLADVLAKVSGDASVLDDPRLTQLHPEVIVADYDYVDRMGGLPHRDEQGSSDRPFWLTARFDIARLDAALRSLDRVAFDGIRATVATLVTVHGASRSFFVTAADDDARPPDHVAAVVAAAERVGVRTWLPPSVEATPPADALSLQGTLTWSDAEHGWIAEWHATWHGVERNWEARGVSFDEAYRAGLRGALALEAGVRR